jgi:hypothetical protein
MPPKAKEKDERGAEEAGPSSEEKDDLAEKELMVAFLRNKLGRCGCALACTFDGS